MRVCLSSSFCGARGLLVVVVVVGGAEGARVMVVGLGVCVLADGCLLLLLLLLLWSWLLLWLWWGGWRGGW